MALLLQRPAPVLRSPCQTLALAPLRGSRGSACLGLACALARPRPSPAAPRASVGRASCLRSRSDTLTGVHPRFARLPAARGSRLLSACAPLRGARCQGLSRRMRSLPQAHSRSPGPSHASAPALLAGSSLSRSRLTSLSRLPRSRRCAPRLPASVVRPSSGAAGRLLGVLSSGPVGSAALRPPAPSARPS